MGHTQKKIMKSESVRNKHPPKMCKMGVMIVSKLKLKKFITRCIVLSLGQN
jgi:hypothetical protein